MPLSIALWSQKHVDLCKFKVILIYKVSSSTSRVTYRNHLLKKIIFHNLFMSKKLENGNKSMGSQGMLGQTQE